MTGAGSKRLALAGLAGATSVAVSVFENNMAKELLSPQMFAIWNQAHGALEELARLIADEARKATE
jgi:hypothetical protein